MKKTTFPREARADSPLMRAFLLGNPILCLNMIARCRRRDKEQAADLRDMLLEYPVQGSSALLKQEWAALGLKGVMNVADVRHVFPTVGIGASPTGFMVPIGIEESPEWHISDAFMRFRFSRESSDLSIPGDPAKSGARPQGGSNLNKFDVVSKPKDPAEGIESLLKLVESAWQRIHPGEALPLRWRHSLSIRVLIPLHLDMIDGESLQVPCLVAVLRALGEALVSATSPARLPFGNMPVFATGTLDANGRFGDVGGLLVKLRGFVREYGEGRPAILTRKQEKDLGRSTAGRLLLRQVVPHIADNLDDLLHLPEMAQGLKRLTESPHPTEIDGLLSEMERMSRGIRFKDVAQICAWLLPKMESPCYRFKLLCTTGLTLCHQGRFIDSGPYLRDAADVLAANPGLFGVPDRIMLASHWGVLAVDAADPSLARPFLRGLAGTLPHASESDRVKYWGTLCQINRIAGKLDDAVAAGRRAVVGADQSLANDAGRDRNYLVHALIARARVQASQRRRDLEEASLVLRDSREKWVPAGNRSAGASHLGFCLHYESEIARLQGKRFTPPATPPWEGEWGHPWLFVLLACARNRAHTAQERLEYADRLIAVKQVTKFGDATLFALLAHTYRIYRAILAGESAGAHLDALEAWCGRCKENGFPGWSRRLGGILGDLRAGKKGAVEALCDAIPYH